MKKILSTLLIFSGFITLSGGYDLKIDGKFRDLNDNGLPGKWYISNTENAKMVQGKDHDEKALQLDASSGKVFMRTHNAFKVRQNHFLKVEAEIKGKGSAFIAIEAFDASGKKIGCRKVATMKGSFRYKDIESKNKISDMFPKCRSFKIIIGADKDSVISICDIDAEIDDD